MRRQRRDESFARCYCFVAPRSCCCCSKKVFPTSLQEGAAVARRKAPAFLFFSSSSPVDLVAAEAAGARRAMAAFDREVLINWAGGDCVFHMSVPISGGPPSRRPKITGDLTLMVDRYRADGRRLRPHIRVILPIGLLDANRLAVVPFAIYDVVHEVAGAWSRSSFHGSLPEVPVLVLADALSLFFRHVAGEMDEAPDLTYVSAVARVRLFNADGDQEVLAEEEGDEEEVATEEEEGEEVEEEEEAGDGVQMEEEPSSTTTPPEMDEEEEEGEAEGEEEEEEARCAICLRRMVVASGAAAEGRRERWWLPCCHSFHRGCLERWLRQKAECPLCRAPADASAGGGVQRDS